MSTRHLGELLQQFTSRYRLALLTQTGILAVLALGVCGLLGWRLHNLHLSPMWGVAVPIGSALVILGGLIWRVRRRWIAPHAAAAQLDRALGLQQRLITAEEFAGAPKAPSLYPLLMEDIMHHYTGGRVRFPRPLDHTAGWLIMLLLLFLLWPGLGQHPLTQLAGPHGGQPPPQDQHQASSSQQDRERKEQGPQGSSRESAPSSGQGGGGSAAQGGAAGQQSSANGSGRSQGAEGGGESRGGPQGAQGQGQGTSQDGNAPGGSARGQPQGPGAQGSQGSTKGGMESNAEGTPQQATAKHGETDDHQGKGAKQESASAGRSAQQHRQGEANREGAEKPSASGNGAQRASEAAQGNETGQQQGSGGQQPSARSGMGQPGGGLGQSPGDQEAMKAQIQQLLKEVSGELKELQAKLDTASSQAQPTAGTGTDPDLYDAPTPIDGSMKGHVPLQLKTDTAPTKAGRASGGVGESSGDVSRANPTVNPEDASLADQPLEESAVSREHIPPEYRSVFDRLHTTETQKPLPAPQSAAARQAGVEAQSGSR